MSAGSSENRSAPESRWARTEAAVRAALGAGDPAALAPLLAPAVRWHGAGPGGCHDRDAVLATLAAMAAGDAGLRLRELRRVADRVLVGMVVEPGGHEVHQLLHLDADGRITLVLDYTDAGRRARPGGSAAGAADGGPGGGTRPVSSGCGTWRPRWRSTACSDSP